MASIRAVWYIAVYGVSALVLMALADWRLGAADAAVVRAATSCSCATSCRACAISRKRQLGGALARDGARGRQLHQHPHREAVRAARRRGRLRARGRSTSTRPRSARTCGSSRSSCSRSSVMNALLLTGTAAIGIWLWAQRHGRARAWSPPRCRSPGRSPTSAGWVSWEVTGIFENIGVVQEGMQTIAVPHARRRSPRRARARGDARRDPLRGRDLQLRPARRPPRARPPQPHDPPRRARRPGRPLGRGQVDAGQPAAALLRAGAGQHPHRRAGHRAT